MQGTCQGTWMRTSAQFASRAAAVLIASLAVSLAITANAFATVVSQSGTTLNIIATGSENNNIGVGAYENPPELVVVELGTQVVMVNGVKRRQPLPLTETALNCWPSETHVSCTPGAFDHVYISTDEGNDNVDQDTSLQSRIFGGGGDDKYLGGGTGFDEIHGGPGADTIDDLGGNSVNAFGFQTIAYGEGGNDTLQFSGWLDHGTNDWLVGGEGDDQITGGSGTDAILSRDSDGSRDPVVNCGSGFDYFRVDQNDPRTNCESPF